MVILPLKPLLTDVKWVQTVITGLTRFSLSLTISTVLTSFNLNEARYSTAQGILYGWYRWIQAKLVVREFLLPFIAPFIWIAQPCYHPISWNCVKICTIFSRYWLKSSAPHEDHSYLVLSWFSCYAALFDFV